MLKGRRPRPANPRGMETHLQERFFEALAEVFAAVDAATPRTCGNPCGECRQCCTARGLTSHAVSDLELDYLARHAGSEGAAAFADYAARRRDGDGEVLHAECPFYDGTTGGCGVYAWRPFSCRTFGHWRVAGTRFPPDCTFAGREVEFPFTRYFDTVPGSRDLHALKRDYAFLRDPGPVRMVPPSRGLTDEDLAYLDEEDPLDRSTRALVAGDLPRALDEARNALAELGGTPSVLYALGSAFEMLGRHAEALLVFDEATRLLPDCADFHYHRGYNLVQSRDFMAGAQALERAVELNPSHSLALGFLGYVLLLDRRTEEAVPWLERAVAVDPANEFFRRRLDEATGKQNGNNC